MKIFFDFDDFFLKTESVLVADFFQFLERITGATQEEVIQTYSKFSGAHFEKGIPYSLEQHIDFLSDFQRFNNEDVKEKAREFFVDLTKYVFKGARNFLKCLPKKDIYLLTYGDGGFQNLKVDGSGLRKFFHQVVVIQGKKSEEIERVARKDNFLTNETIIFCDNRCGHFTGAKERGIITIHLKRPTDKYSKDPCGECRYCVSNFKELYECIMGLT
jgi:FMN phosphatase YigB (HAD superfamily)